MKLQVSHAACFCRYISSGKGTKGKNNQMGPPPTKTFLRSYRTIIKMEREPPVWENMFAHF